MSDIGELLKKTKKIQKALKTEHLTSKVYKKPLGKLIKLLNIFCKRTSIYEPLWNSTMK